MGTHTVKDSRKSRWEPWLIRKIIYSVLSAIIFIAVGTGLISPEQSDVFLTNADKILAIVTGLGLLGAAVKTTAASDVPLSEIEQARADVAAAKLTPSMVDDLVAQAKLAAITVKDARTPHPASAAASIEAAKRNAATAVAQAESADLPVYTGPTTA